MANVGRTNNIEVSFSAYHFALRTDLFDGSLDAHGSTVAWLFVLCRHTDRAQEGLCLL